MRHKANISVRHGSCINKKCATLDHLACATCKANSTRLLAIMLTLTKTRPIMKEYDQNDETFFSSEEDRNSDVGPKDSRSFTFKDIKTLQLELLD